MSYVSIQIPWLLAHDESFEGDAVVDPQDVVGFLVVADKDTREEVEDGVGALVAAFGGPFG